MNVATGGMQHRECPAGSGSGPVPALGAGVDEEAIRRAAAVYKALGDPVRLRLYLAVAHEAGGGEICVCDIPDVGVSQSTVSHHLRKLREAGLLHSRRVGTWVYYRAAADGSGALAVLGLVGRAPGVPSRPEG